MSRATGVVVAAVLAWRAASCAADDGPLPKPLPADIVTAWEKAGAERGWMGPDRSGFIVFRAVGEGNVGEMPAFAFEVLHNGVVGQLPPPGRPFGLDLFNSGVADADMKDLAALKHLQILELTSTRVTNVGLKDLAGLKQLQMLVGRQSSIDGLGGLPFLED